MIADLDPASSLIDDQCEAIELCKVGLSLLSRAPDQRPDSGEARRAAGRDRPAAQQGSASQRDCPETAVEKSLCVLCALCDSVVARSCSVIIIR